MKLFAMPYSIPYSERALFGLSESVVLANGTQISTNLAFREEWRIIVGGSRQQLSILSRSKACYQKPFLEASNNQRSVKDNNNGKTSL